MKWKDPQSFICSTCGKEGEYSVSSLRSFQAECTYCGALLEDASHEMIKSEEKIGQQYEVLLFLVHVEEQTGLEFEDEVVKPLLHDEFATVGDLRQAFSTTVTSKPEATISLDRFLNLLSLYTNTDRSEINSDMPLNKLFKHA